MKKRLYRFENTWQADLVTEMLKNEGLQVSQIKTAREYSSIITGIGEGAIELYVEDGEYEAALSVLNLYLRRTNLSLVIDENEKTHISPRRERKWIFGIIVILLLLLLLFNWG